MVSDAAHTVLVVDDEPVIVEILRAELTDAGLEVITAASGNGAQGVLRERHCDLILSDFQMPDGTGLELLQAVKANQPTTPFLIFLSDYSALHPAAAYAKGAEAILEKPWRAEPLLAHVQRLLTRPETRWKRNRQRPASGYRVELRCASFREGLSNRALSLGRGGMFVPLDGDLPSLGDTVLLSFRAATGAEASPGCAIVRWVRPQPVPGGPRGIGVEFLELDEAEIQAVLDFSRESGARAYIPEV